MTIQETINNGKKVFEITEDNGDLFLVEAETEELALEKYNEMKEREARPKELSVEQKRKAEYLERGRTPLS